MQKGTEGRSYKSLWRAMLPFFSSTSPVTSQLRWKNVARQNAPCLISHVLFKQPFSNPQIACWTLLHIAPTILMFSKNYGLVNNKTTTERDPKSCTDKIFHETASPLPLPSSTSAVELRRKKTALTHFAHTNGSLITLHTPLFSHEKGRDLSPNTKKKPRRNAFATLKYSQFSATLQVRRIQGRRKKKNNGKETAASSVVVVVVVVVVVALVHITERERTQFWYPVIRVDRNWPDDRFRLPVASRVTSTEHNVCSECFSP